MPIPHKFKLKQEIIITPDLEYNQYLNTLPDNQRFTPNDQYDSYLYWKLYGKPKNFEEAYSKGMFHFDNSDSGYHANSIAWGDNGIGYFIKPKTHPTVHYETDWFNKGLVTEEGGWQRPETFIEYKESQPFREEYILVNDPNRPNFYMYLRRYDDGGELNKPLDWNDLSIKEKAAYIKMGVANGYKDIDSIKQYYREFKNGGSKKQTFLNTLEASLKNNSRYNTPEWKKFLTDLAEKESSFTADTINNIGAKGYFQLMPSNRSEVWELPTQLFEEMYKLTDANILYLKKNMTQLDIDTANKLGIDLYGLIAGAHLGGAKNVLKTLRGVSNAKDSNGTSVMDYMTKFSQTAKPLYDVERSSIQINYERPDAIRVVPVNNYIPTVTSSNTSDNVPRNSTLQHGINVAPIEEPIVDGGILKEVTVQAPRISKQPAFILYSPQEILSLMQALTAPLEPMLPIEQPYTATDRYKKLISLTDNKPSLLLKELEENILRNTLLGTLDLNLLRKDILELLFYRNMASNEGTLYGFGSWLKNNIFNPIFGKHQLDPLSNTPHWTDSYDKDLIVNDLISDPLYNNVKHDILYDKYKKTSHYKKALNEPWRQEDMQSYGLTEDDVVLDLPFNDWLTNTRKGKRMAKKYDNTTRSNYYKNLDDVFGAIKYLDEYYNSVGIPNPSTLPKLIFKPGYVAGGGNYNMDNNTITLGMNYLNTVSDSGGAYGTAAHEYAHYRDPYLLPTRYENVYPLEHRDLYAKSSPDYLHPESYSTHDSKPWENYADLARNRALMYKYGIYDSRKGMEIPMKAIKKFNKKFGKFSRSFRLYTPLDIYNMHKVIAYNSYSYPLINTALAESINTYLTGGGLKGGKSKGDAAGTTLCAAWSNGLLRNNGYFPYGNAWTLGNVDTLYNGFEGITKPEVYDRAVVEAYNHAAADSLYKNFDSNTLDIEKPYIVNMYYNNSKHLEDAYEDGKDVTGTHTGVLTYEKPLNKWMVTHNIDGTIYQDPFIDLQHGNRKYGVTAVYKPRENTLVNKIKDIFGFAYGGSINKFEDSGYKAPWVLEAEEKKRLEESWLQQLAKKYAQSVEDAKHPSGHYMNEVIVTPLGTSLGTVSSDGMLDNLQSTLRESAAKERKQASDMIKHIHEGTSEAAKVLAPLVLAPAAGVIAEGLPILVNNPVTQAAFKLVGRPTSSLTLGLAYYAPSVSKAIPYTVGFDKALMTTLGIEGVKDAATKWYNNEMPWYQAIPQAGLSGLMVAGEMIPVFNNIKSTINSFKSSPSTNLEELEKLINNYEFRGAETKVITDPSNSKFVLKQGTRGYTLDELNLIIQENEALKNYSFVLPSEYLGATTREDNLLYPIFKQEKIIPYGRDAIWGPDKKMLPKEKIEELKETSRNIVETIKQQAASQGLQLLNGRVLTPHGLIQDFGELHNVGYTVDGRPVIFDALLNTSNKLITPNITADNAAPLLYLGLPTSEGTLFQTLLALLLEHYPLLLIQTLNNDRQ